MCIAIELIFFLKGHKGEVKYLCMYNDIVHIVDPFNLENVGMVYISLTMQKRDIIRPSWINEAFKIYTWLYHSKLSTALLPKLYSR